MNERDEKFTIEFIRNCLMPDYHQIQEFINAGSASMNDITDPLD